jgi:DNA-binding transcriptional ArsR family regulator
MTALESLTRHHKALSHPARLRILAMLEGGELCACQIAAVLELAPSTISRHVAELRNAGLVIERKDGRWVFFALADRQADSPLANPVSAELRRDPQVEADAVVARRLRAVPAAVLCEMGGDADRIVALVERGDGR